MLRVRRHPTLTSGEKARGGVFFLLCVFVFPFAMGLAQRSFSGEWPAAEANLVCYLLLTAAALLLLWRFLRESFEFLLDNLPENLLALLLGGGGGLVLWRAALFLPLPENPSVSGYAQEYLLSPAATGVLVVLLMPLLEEFLFRGVLFTSLRPYSRPLAWCVSAAGWSLYCVWQFVFSPGGIDLRLLLLAIEYLPFALGLTWCCEAGGSVWTAAACHAVFNAVFLIRAVRL